MRRPYQIFEHGTMYILIESIFSVSVTFLILSKIPLPVKITIMLILASVLAVYIYKIKDMFIIWRLTMLFLVIGLVIWQIMRIQG